MDVDPNAEAYHEAVETLQKYANYMQHDLLTRLGVPQLRHIKDSGLTGPKRLYTRIRWAKDRLEAIECIRTP